MRRPSAVATAIIRAPAGFDIRHRRASAAQTPSMPEWCPYFARPSRYCSFARLFLLCLVAAELVSYSSADAFFTSDYSSPACFLRSRMPDTRRMPPMSTFISFSFRLLITTRHESPLYEPFRSSSTSPSFSSPMYSRHAFLHFPPDACFRLFRQALFAPQDINRPPPRRRRLRHASLFFLRG